MKNYISIPEPCHENWNNMIPTEKGRFCSSCQKEVLDFTNETKDETTKKINEAGSNLCVRIPKDYLDHTVNIKAAGISKNSKYGIAGALIAATALTPFISPTVSNDIKELGEKNTIQVNAIQPIKISGTVVDEFDKPLSGVKIEISQDKHRAAAHSFANGRFQFQLDPNKIKTGKAILRISKYGYTEYEKSIELKEEMLNGKFMLASLLEEIKMEIPLIEEIEPIVAYETVTLEEAVVYENVTYTERHMLGGAIISHVYREVEVYPIVALETKEEIINDVEEIIPNSLNLYPNPTVDVFKAEMKKEGNYTIYIFAIDGKMIYEKDFNSNIHEVSLSEYERGYYIVMITDRETGEKFDGKITLMR